MSNEPITGWKRWVWPLTSRKFLTAAATAVLVYLAAVGIDVPQDVSEKVIAAIGIIVPGLGFILGTAWEDAAQKGS